MLPNILEVQPNVVNANTKSKVFWFHGEPGSWKTTVACQFSKPLLAAFEIGYQFIDGIRAVQMNSWSDMKDLFRQLQTKKAKETYDTIIFDTISAASKLCYTYVLNSLGVDDPNKSPYGTGWRRIKSEWNLLHEISNLGYGIVFISHSKETEVYDDQTKQVSIKVKTDLDGWATDVVSSLTDFTLYVRKETEEDGKTQNVYAYSELPNVETKRRLNTFPTRILFTYDKLMAALKDAILDKTNGQLINDDINLREVKEENWAEVRESVINLIQRLSGTPFESEVYRFIPEVFGEKKISQTTEVDREKLITARDYLLDLAGKVE